MPRHWMSLVLAAALLMSGGTARGEDWPTRPITLVVPYAAGGPTDAIGRLFAQQIGEILNRSIVVENVGGAGGMVGASRVARALPDGYHVLFVGSAMTYSQHIYAKPLFNSVTDFAPVALLTRQPLVLIARKDLPANGLQDFMRHIKTSKSANFGSAGAGSSTHLGCVMMNVAMNVEVAHVPYRGVALAMPDLLGGRIDYMCNLIQDALPQVQEGNVKAIATLSRSRSPILPDLPTADEQGLAKFDIADWYGLFLPKGAPPSIVQKLHDAAIAALDLPSFRERLQSLGVEVAAAERRSTQYLAGFLKDEIERWAAPIKAAGIAAQ
jgi:tripartite-type tricarboxylate transporter receptor subunit TctC